MNIVLLITRRLALSWALFLVTFLSSVAVSFGQDRITSSELGDFYLYSSQDSATFKPQLRDSRNQIACPKGRAFGFLIDLPKDNPAYGQLESPLFLATPSGYRNLADKRLPPYLVPVTLYCEDSTGENGRRAKVTSYVYFIWLARTAPSSNLYMLGCPVSQQMIGFHHSVDSIPKEFDLNVSPLQLVQVRRSASSTALTLRNVADFRLPPYPFVIHFYCASFY